jgi:4-hydroxybenzoate polyprenyltransferase
MLSETPIRRNPLIVLVQAMRVYQWSKNLLVFAALLFAQEVFHADKLFTSFLAFVAFCLAASATYLFNDLQDIEKDRAHPKKCARPIASGAMPVAIAWVALVALYAGAGALALYIGVGFTEALAAYLVLTLLYTLVLKHMIILDVMAVALGFVLRAMAGALAIQVEFSNWLVVCTLFLALFLGLSKRRHEMTLLEGGAGSHRKVLEDYSVHYLDQLILIVAGGAIITYTIYTCSPEVVDRFGSDKLYLTLPFVVYGVFRYLYLVHHKTGGGDPSRTLVTDVPLLTTVFLWAAACAVIIYGRQFG